MRSILNIIKFDYLQRTRSYTFLITLCASLAIAYTFVPAPNANYSTLNIGDYIGYYNSAWLGYVTAVMTSKFLFLIGFYLVNSGIKNDIYTKIGQITASTTISNFRYLFSKALSNFLILLTIVVMIFIMSIVLFILYNDGYSFQITQFIKPYVFIVIPSMFLVAVLAVLFEVVLANYSIVQNILFFFLFTALTSMTFLNSNFKEEYHLDILGSNIVIDQLEQSVQDITNSSEVKALSIGYVISDRKINKFEFNGIDFPTPFVLSRLGWIGFGIVLIYLVSHFFHRFKLKNQKQRKRKTDKIHKPLAIKEIPWSLLTVPSINYSILPLIKTELLLLIRKGKKWLWLFNIIGLILLVTLPLKTAHQIVLPILWFLQVGRLSDLTTKEQTNNMHYFALASYKPISRLLTAQLMSAIILLLILAMPLIIRLGIASNFIASSSIILGSVFIVLLAAVLGIVFKGKKLFEVLFFMVTYANINGIPFTDYFGGFEHGKFYLLKLTIIILSFGIISILIRQQKLQD